MAYIATRDLHVDNKPIPAGATIHDDDIRPELIDELVRLGAIIGEDARDRMEAAFLATLGTLGTPQPAPDDDGDGDGKTGGGPGGETGDGQGASPPPPPPPVPAKPRAPARAKSKAATPAA